MISSLSLCPLSIYICACVYGSDRIGFRYTLSLFLSFSFLFSGPVICVKINKDSRLSPTYIPLSPFSLIHGYQCDPSWISRPLTSGETNESVLWGHSKKLAIAFQLIQHPKPSVIQVVKNLRICGDCRKLFLLNFFPHTLHIHVSIDTVIKLIARIRQCLIVVHDANRIHHFDPTGNCSCNDRF